MTPLSPARRAAEEFAGIVDGSLRDVDGRYAELSGYVQVLRAQEPPVARPEFVADLRAQLMAAADTDLVPALARGAEETEETATVTRLRVRRPRSERRLGAAAAAFVLVAGTAGVAAAAENSLPGDPLYPLKRSIESAQVSLNTNDVAKGEDLINQASTRLDEVAELMSSDSSTTEVTHTLSSFQRSATSGADLLFVAYQRDGDPTGLGHLRSALTSQMSLLDTLARQAPAPAQPAFDAARSLLSDLDQQARVLCGDCGAQAALPQDLALSSASALESMLSKPASAVKHAAAVANQNQSLAQQAEDAAKNGAGDLSTGSSAPGGSTAPGSDTSRPASSSPDVAGTLSSSGTAVKKTVTGLTDGVKSLLDQVDTLTGGLTEPLTTTVDQTLDTVTNLLP